MEKRFENIVEIDSRELFDEISSYCDVLIDEATLNGYLSEQGADNEYTREIGRIGNLCAEYEDRKMQFKEIVVRGRSPLIRALQEEMFKRDIKQKEIAQLIGINETAFSLFMNGKRGLSMGSARKLYQKLHINPKLIIEYA
ncbi:MAG: helix-turn-helix domain-containing protein [Bacteroidales bacterium]|jgi:antitoxin component HigA of HigAB toxin-antitoxin module|nr:helix-turn-helix domain-containing protein [Bacteroidales bacterium]